MHQVSLWVDYQLNSTALGRHVAKLFLEANYISAGTQAWDPYPRWYSLPLVGDSDFPSALAIYKEYRLQIGNYGWKRGFRAKCIKST